VELHKKYKGDIAELVVAAKMVEMGWRVLFPYGENARYDLVGEQNGRFIRIQVKYTTPKNGVMDTNCRSSNNWSIIHYTPADIDFIAAYNPQDREVYFIPAHKINKSTFKLRLDEAKNNQKLKINMAKDFLGLNMRDIA